MNKFQLIVINRIAAHKTAEAEKDKAAKEAEAARIAAAVEAERKAGEARAAAAAIEAERMAEAKRVADIAKFNDNQIAAHQEAEANRVAEGARNALKDAILGDVLAASDMGQSLDGLAGKSVRAADHIADAGKMVLDTEAKRAVLVEAGDEVRSYLNTLGVSEKEFGRLRAVLMGFIQFQAERALRAAA